MATLSSILVWEIPWTEEPGVLQSMGHQESDMTERVRARIHTHTHTHISDGDKQITVMGQLHGKEYRDYER